MIELTLSSGPNPQVVACGRSAESWYVASWICGELWFLEALIRGRVAGWSAMTFGDLASWKSSWGDCVAAIGRYVEQHP